MGRTVIRVRALEGLMEATANRGRAVGWPNTANAAMAGSNAAAEDPRSGEGARGWTMLAQQSGDAVSERSAACGHDRPEMGRACRFQLGQGAGISDRVAGDGHGQVVATQFALGADVAGYPPHRGMVEQQSLDDALQRVDQIIVPADVRQFVEEKRFHLAGRQPGECADRHQDGGTKPAHYCRRLDQTRHQQADRTGDANAGLEPVESLLPFARRRTNQPGAQPFREDPAA